MTLSKFISNFQSQFDELQKLNEDTNFKKLKSWDSMTALLVITMIDDEYNVSIGGDDIRKADTILDLYNIVVAKKDM
jgi:acyl carrier protein